MPKIDGLAFKNETARQNSRALLHEILDLERQLDQSRPADEALLRALSGTRVLRDGDDSILDWLRYQATGWIRYEVVASSLSRSTKRDRIKELERLDLIETYRECGLRAAIRPTLLGREFVQPAAEIKDEPI